MESNIFEMQQEFLTAANVPQHTYEAEELANKLIEEEYKEFTDTYFILNDATTDAERAHCVKEALDLMYVTAQYLNATIGPKKAQLALDLLHENNMLKVEMKAERRADGKVLKPANLPSIEHALELIIRN